MATFGDEGSAIMRTGQETAPGQLSAGRFLHFSQIQPLPWALPSAQGARELNSLLPPVLA